MNKLTAALMLAAFLTAPITQAITDPNMQDEIRVRGGEMLMADPETIIELRRHIQRNSAARQAPIVDDFSEGMSQDVLDLEDIFDITLQPDDIAPRLVLARFQSTAVSFVDAYGNPWPIRRVVSFLDGMVAIDRASGDEDIEMNDPQAGSFTMTALRHGVVGNITVYLHGLSTPISILLEGKAGVFHRIATMRVSEAGPQTDLSAMFSNSAVRIGAAADVDLNNALYGVTPAASTQMIVSGAEGRAWVKGEHLYLQTPLAVFSPQILSVSHGNGRFRAYKLPLTTTVLGTNNAGQTVQMRIERVMAGDNRALEAAR